MELLKNFEQHFDSQRLKDGKEYFKMGLVKSVTADGDKVSAIVEGNRNYRVKIDLKKGDFQCTCPCDFNCKHQAALCYFLRSNKTDDISKITKELASKSKEELLEMVQKLLMYNPEAINLFNYNDMNVEKEIKQLWIRYEDDFSSFYHKFDQIVKIISMRDQKFPLLYKLLDRLIDLSDHGWNNEEELDSCFEEVLSLVNEELKKMNKKEANKIKKEIEYRLSNFDYLLDLLDQRK